MSDGALLVDKPVGMSSNQALQQAKRLVGARKAGHGGTLDPLASGLLVVLLGEGTKFAGPMLDADKEYFAQVKLGEKTTTGDAEGTLLGSRPVEVSRQDIAAVLGRFRGTIEQLPPMHSALKQGGVPLYKLARKGETVARAARRVEILALELLAWEPPIAALRIRASKGTYVRTLAEDIGEALGTGAHLAGLRRTASGRFRIEQAHTLEALAALPEPRQAALPLSALLEGLPRAELDERGEERLRTGQPVQVAGVACGLCAIFGAGDRVIGLGRAEPQGGLKAVRLTQAAEKAPKTL